MKLKIYTTFTYVFAFLLSTTFFTSVFSREASWLILAGIFFIFFFICLNKLLSIKNEIFRKERRDLIDHMEDQLLIASSKGTFDSLIRGKYHLIHIKPHNIFIKGEPAYTFNYEMDYIESWLCSRANYDVYHVLNRHQVYRFTIVVKKDSREVFLHPLKVNKSPNEALLWNNLRMELRETNRSRHTAAEFEQIFPSVQIPQEKIS